MSSQFLPDNFRADSKIAVIAGKGLYPILTVENLRKGGIPCCLVAFEEETSIELYNSFDSKNRVMLKVGQLGHLLKALQKFEANYAIMAGQITPRRLFKGLHPDLKAIIILHRLREKNAETIFGAIAEEMLQIKVPLLDARCFLDHELAHKGLMTNTKSSIDETVLQHGIHIAKSVASLDIGQGVVVNNGTVLAVEAFEGTDAMLRRAGSFEAKQPLFIKTVKPNQDYRFDVPVFGMKTIEVLHEANIPHAALEANKTLILQKEIVLQAASKYKITILGY